MNPNEGIPPVAAPAGCITGKCPACGHLVQNLDITQPPPIVVEGPASKEKAPEKPKGRLKLPSGLPPTEAPAKPQISPLTAPDEPVLLGVPWKPDARPAAVLGAQLPHLTTAPSNTEAAILDHPIIGGKVTVCVLCYGKDHFNLHQRCLEKIAATVPKDRMELRVGLNEVSLDTLNYVERMDPFKIYNHPENAKKYPVMREMFHDPAAPLTTNYLIWFDDDSYVVNEKWLYRLCETIIENHPHGNRLYGIKFFHQLQIDLAQGVDQRKWFQSAPWHKGRNFRTRQGIAAPNGDSICFVSGGFLALGVDAIKACDIPCARLLHNGGDITIGEQVWQGGFGMKDFNRGKELIYSSGAERRGYSENFPWRR